MIQSPYMAVPSMFSILVNTVRRSLIVFCLLSFFSICRNLDVVPIRFNVMAFSYPSLRPKFVPGAGTHPACTPSTRCNIKPTFHAAVFCWDAGLRLTELRSYDDTGQKNKIKTNKYKSGPRYHDHGTFAGYTGGLLDVVPRCCCCDPVYRDGLLSVTEFIELCRSLFRNCDGEFYALEAKELADIFSLFDVNKVRKLCPIARLLVRCPFVGYCCNIPRKHKAARDQARP